MPIRSLTPIALQASQGFVSIDQDVRALTLPTARIGYALGPSTFRTAQDHPYSARWAAWPSASGVMLKAVPSGLVWPPDESGIQSPFFSSHISTNHLSLAFDQTAFEQVAYQLNATTIEIRKSGGNVSFSGFSPTLVYNRQFNSDITSGASDVVCYYLRPGINRIYARLQRDNYGVEYVAANLSCQPIDIRQSWFSAETGNAYAFSGAGGSHVTIPPVALTGDFTVCFWAFAPGETTANFFGGGDQTLGSGYQGYFRLAGGYLSLAVDGEAMRISSGTHPYSFGIAQWQHLAITRTGNDYRIYTGATLLGSVVTSTAGTLTVRMIGNSYAPAAATHAFGGSMYDFRIYSAAKSGAQLAAIAQGNADTASLVRRYRMAESPQTGLEEGGQTATLAGVTLGSQPLRGPAEVETRVHRMEVLDSGMRSSIISTSAYPYPLVVAPQPPPYVPTSTPIVDIGSLRGSMSGAYETIIILAPNQLETANLRAAVEGSYFTLLASPSSSETTDRASLAGSASGSYSLTVIGNSQSDNASLAGVGSGSYTEVIEDAGTFQETANLTALVTGGYA